MNIYDYIVSDKFIKFINDLVYTISDDIKIKQHLRENNIKIDENILYFHLYAHSLSINYKEGYTLIYWNFYNREKYVKYINVH